MGLFGKATWELEAETERQLESLQERLASAGRKIDDYARDNAHLEQQVHSLRQFFELEHDAKMKAEKRADGAETRYHALVNTALEMRREGFAAADAPPSELLQPDEASVPQEFIDAVVEVYGSARHPSARKDLAWAELALRKSKNNPEEIPRIALRIQEGMEHEA